jgi:hypothetical protein
MKSDTNYLYAQSCCSGYTPCVAPYCISPTGPSVDISTLFASIPPGTSVFIDNNKTLRIDINFTFDNLQIRLGTNARIRIRPNKTLTINNGTCITALTQTTATMGQGILIDDNTATLDMENSCISWCKRAVDSNNGGVYDLRNNTFENNDFHVLVQTYASPHLGTMEGNTFTNANQTAIWADQVLSINFGSALTSSNTINGAANQGILLEQTTAVINNFVITNCANANGIFADGGVGGIWRVTVGNTSPVYISNCNRGLRARDNYEAIIYNSSFNNDAQNGIWITNASGVVDIQGNQLVDCGNAVNFSSILFENPGNLSQLLISKNDIKAPSLAYQVGEGIRVRFLSWPSPTGFDIVGNSIDNKEVGIQVWNYSLDQGGHVFYNTITNIPFGTTNNSRRIGIEVQDSRWVQVWRNTISTTGVLTSTARWPIGILVDESNLTNGGDLVDITCNDIFDCQRYMEAEMDMPLLDFSGNVMYGSGLIGWSLKGNGTTDGGDIGNQGLVNFPSDNQWDHIPAGGITYRMGLDNTPNSNLTTIWYKNSSQEFNPLLTSIYNTSWPLPTFTITSGNNVDCNNPSPFRTGEGGEGEGMFMAASQGGEGYQSWFDQAAMIEALLSNNIAVSSYASLIEPDGAWYNCAQMQLFEIGKLIGTENFDLAQSNLNNFVPSNVPETAYRDFYSLYLTALQNGTLTPDADMESALWNLANICPNEGGMATSSARNWLLQFYPDTTFTCVGQNDLSRKGLLQNNYVSNPEFQLFPNPANNSLSIIGYQENEIITIYSTDGQVQHVQKTSKNTFDISGLKNGLYLVTKQSGNQISTCRFIKL